MIYWFKFCQEIFFYFSGFIFDFRTFLFFDIVEFLPQVKKNFSKILFGLVYPLLNISFISEIFYMIIFLELYIFKNDFSWALEPLLHYNPLINLFKNPTKIWGCHVMFRHHFYAKVSFSHLEILSPTPNFQIWSSLQFCITTYLNISLTLPPKLGDVSSSV